jgi:hypothetical protein
VRDRIAARGDAVRQAKAVVVRLRGLAAGDPLHLTLVETDGSSWSATVRADTAWTEQRIPLSSFVPARSAMLPEGYPGEWNYAMRPLEAGDGMRSSLRPADIERLQLSLRPRGNAVPRLEIEWVRLVFD